MENLYMPVPPEGQYQKHSGFLQGIFQILLLY